MENYKTPKDWETDRRYCERITRRLTIDILSPLHKAVEAVTSKARKCLQPPYISFGLGAPRVTWSISEWLDYWICKFLFGFEDWDDIQQEKEK